MLSLDERILRVVRVLRGLGASYVKVFTTEVSSGSLEFRLTEDTLSIVTKIRHQSGDYFYEDREFLDEDGLLGRQIKDYCLRHPRAYWEV